MTGDELFAAAEAARKTAIQKALKDGNVWRGQLILLATGLIKVICIHMAIVILLASLGMPVEASVLIGFMLATALGCLNPYGFIHRSLFHEIGDEAFNAVIDQHKPKS